MDPASLIVTVLVIVVALMVLRFVIGAIKASAKLLLWGVVIVVVLGAGYLWYQGQGPGQAELPSLSIPGAPE